MRRPLGNSNRASLSTSCPARRRRWLTASGGAARWGWWVVGEPEYFGALAVGEIGGLGQVAHGQA
jgi:hypothetical protein